ncbi:GINS complex, Psf1 component [Eremomyces bilateralis CBS 781.70]|uniref:DNA replication complex GINS protein PSF1 n=1 Tax=Eremomyces bilateralis CBS 781.70 TaxID=1392243 RepID=A0A6G1GGX5_9PEZI|nr:GINS complex, Psf1 component [Eremomyces bilateralis CBS 781.70]KAF1817357.1 GINS complex, Psf1 component [Eremomyces bilateralis CBS 781.70]
MYGELGLKLVRDAKRVQNLPSLPSYQTDLVRSTVREVRDLDRDNARILEPYTSASQAGTPSTFNPQDDPATACALLVNHLAMRRNKRCLLAYHRVRAQKLEEACWAGVDVLDRQAGGDGAGNGEEGGQGGAAAMNLSPEEEEYVRRYSDLLAAYKGQWTDIDLTGSLEPPRDLFVDVRVLKDAGEIQTEYGAITLSKNSQLYVKESDVERLIQQGYLQKLS